MPDNSIKCGKVAPNGQQLCGVFFGDLKLKAGTVLMSRFFHERGGAWQEIKAAKGGARVPSERWQRHQNQHAQYPQRLINLRDFHTMPKVVCPRCHELQTILSSDDLKNVLRHAILAPTE